MSYNATRLRAPNLYTMNFTAAGGSAYDFGLMDAVNVSLELVTAPITVGTLGDVEIGEWIIALKGKLTTFIREVDVTTFQKIMPWYSSGAIPLTPATWRKDMYAYAGLLTLHPTDVSGTTQDITLLKALPRPNVMSRDGKKKEEGISLDWKFWPDRSQLVADAPLLAYGYIGATPS